MIFSNCNRMLGLVGGVCLALTAGCSKQAEKPPSNAARPVPVNVAFAKQQPLDRTLQAVGSLQAWEDAVIAAQVAGQIEKVLVDIGSTVAEGQELALIDTTSYLAFARQSSANLEKARASERNANQNLERVRTLQRDKIASGSEYDTAVAESEQAHAEVLAAEAADAIAQLNLARSRVRAPFSGRVAARVASPGEYVGVGTPIVRLVKTDPLRLKVSVPERDAAQIRLDQIVRLTVEGDTNVYTGRISRIAPAIRELDRMLPVEADVPSQNTLRPGLFARAQIVVATGEMAVCVPAQSVVTFAGIEKLLCIKDGVAREQTIRTGRRAGNWVEILDGVKSGDMVALDAAGLQTGQPVTVNTPEPVARTGGS